MKTLPAPDDKTPERPAPGASWAQTCAAFDQFLAEVRPLRLAASA